jgi:hypothetical protein
MFSKAAAMVLSGKKLLAYALFVRHLRIIDSDARCHALQQFSGYGQSSCRPVYGNGPPKTFLKATNKSIRRSKIGAFLVCLVPALTVGWGQFTESWELYTFTQRRERT